MVETKVDRSSNSNGIAHYEYNQLKILLFELEGGDIAPYEELLQRRGISSKSEVSVQKFKDISKREIFIAFRDIQDDIYENYEKTEQNTLLHCYISAGSGQTRLSSHGKIEIMFAGGFWFEFE